MLLPNEPAAWIVRSAFRAPDATLLACCERTHARSGAFGKRERGRERGALMYAAREGRKAAWSILIRNYWILVSLVEMRHLETPP